MRTWCLLFGIYVLPSSLPPWVGRQAGRGIAVGTRPLVAWRCDPVEEVLGLEHDSFPPFPVRKIILRWQGYTLRQNHVILRICKFLIHHSGVLSTSKAREIVCAHVFSLRFLIPLRRCPCFGISFCRRRVECAECETCFSVAAVGYVAGSMWARYRRLASRTAS